jgi:hypothetical protein
MKMTLCYFSCLGRYCFRPTSMAALSSSALACCPDASKFYWVNHCRFIPNNYVHQKLMHWPNIFLKNVRWSIVLWWIGTCIDLFSKECIMGNWMSTWEIGERKKVHVAGNYPSTPMPQSLGFQFVQTKQHIFHV